MSQFAGVVRQVAQVKAPQVAHAAAIARAAEQYSDATAHVRAGGAAAVRQALAGGGGAAAAGTGGAGGVSVVQQPITLAVHGRAIGDFIMEMVNDEHGPRLRPRT